MPKIDLPVFAPTSRATLEIAGRLTVSDWVARRDSLSDASAVVWEGVFDDYLRQRLQLRYLDPIAILQTNGTFRGEGFSIVTIQVALIEFLAATVAGKIYRFRAKGDPPLLSHEYERSGALFVSFLVAEAPFGTEFSKPIAEQVYRNVRCGLLHEARTKKGWSIWAQSEDGRMVDGMKKLVFRNNVQSGLEEFLAKYRGRVGKERALQEAFVRKIDSLCME